MINVLRPPEKVIRNSKLSAIISGLYANLIGTDPKENYHSLAEFMEKSNFNGTHGLLHEVEEQCNKDGTPLTFDLIAEEEFSLNMLLSGTGYDLETYLYQEDLNPTGNELGKQISEAIVDLMKKKIKDLLRHLPDNKALKEFQSVTTNTSLSSFLTQTDSFMSTWREKIKGLHFEQTFVSNTEILQHLETKGSINATDYAGDSAWWNPLLKKNMDALISREVSEGITGTINWVTRFSEGLRDTFSNSMPTMKSVFEKYPYNLLQLRKDYPLLDKQLEALETQLVENEGADETQIQGITKQIENLSRGYYKKKIEEDNPDLADVLGELREKDFDFSLIDEARLQNLLNWVKDQKIEDMEVKKVISDIFNIKQPVDEINFKNFMKDLVDIKGTEIKIPNGNVIFRVKKTIKSWSNPDIKNLHILSQVDALPLEYEIDLENTHNLTVENRMQLNGLLSDCMVDANQKVAKLSGDKIGRLIYLYFIGNQINNLENISADSEEKLKNKLGEFNETYEEKPKEKLKEPEEKEKDKNDFLEARKGIKGYGFEKEEQNLPDDKKTYGFKTGTRLRVAVWDSEIPPLENGGKQWVQMEILDTTSHTDQFKVRLSGGELKAGGYENKEIWLDKSKEQIQHFQDKSGWFLKLPNPKDSPTPIDHLQKLLDANIPEEKKLKSAFDELQRDGKQFVGKFFDAEKGSTEAEPVKYFGYQDTEYDAEGKEHKQNIMFEVDHNPSKKTFTVKGSFVKHETNDKGKEEVKRYNLGSDGREMDYNNFMLFIAEKGLKPRKTSEAKALKDQQDKKDISVVNAKKRKRNRVSLKTAVAGIKGIWKKIKDGIDQHGKDQVDQFNDRMIEDLGIYDIVAKTLGFIPSVKDAAAGLQMEHYLERDNKTRKKIDFWLGKFRSDPDFWTSFETPGKFFSTMFGGKSLQSFILGGKDLKSATIDDIPHFEPPMLHVVAATLIANIEKGGGMYRGLAKFSNSGLWIKALLGPEHHKQFLRAKADLIAEIRSGKSNSDQLQDQLAKCEIEYITNNINGAAGGQRFWSYEKRGIPGKDGTDYIDNPSKRLLSGKFASELDSTFNKWGSKSSVEEKFNGIGHNNFQLAKVDFERFLSSDRFPAALANFKKMGMLIKTPEHHRIFQRCFTTLLLSGQLQTHADKSLRKWMVQIARTYGFAPGMVVKDFDHPEKVYHLLKVASDGSFAAAVNYKPSDFNASSNNVNLKKLKEDIEKRWNSEGNYHKMGDFFKNELMTTNWNNPDDKEHYDPVLQNFKDKMTENAEELTDNDLIQNPEFANHGGLFSSKAVINSMMRYSRGKFDGEDPEKIAAKQLFWKNLTSDIKHIDTSNSSALETLVKQFLMMFSEKGFGEWDKEQIVKALKTAKKCKGIGGSVGEISTGAKDPATKKTYSTGKVEKDDRENVLKYTIQGTILESGNNKPPEEFKSAIEAFYEMFKKNIDTIADDAFISKIFGSAYTNEKGVESLDLIGWTDYNRVFVKGNAYFYDDDEDEDEGGTWDTKERKAERARKQGEYRNRTKYINEYLKDKDARLLRLGIDLGGNLNDVSRSKKRIEYRSAA